MTHRITIEERLEVFAQGGLTHGFTLRLWDSKAKSLEKQGIVLSNPKPTGRKGENQYEIDFSLPLPGTFSQELYNIAMECCPVGVENLPSAEPLHPPYSQD